MRTGKRVRELRTELRLTQEELAGKCGLSKGMISLIESDSRKAGRETLEALADIFNVDVDYLLCRTDIKNSSAADQAVTEPRREYLRRRINIASPEELRWLELSIRLHDADRGNDE